MKRNNIYKKIIFITTIFIFCFGLFSVKNANASCPKTATDCPIEITATATENTINIDGKLVNGGQVFPDFYIYFGKDNNPTKIGIITGGKFNESFATGITLTHTTTSKPFNLKITTGLIKGQSYYVYASDDGSTIFSKAPVVTIPKYTTSGDCNVLSVQSTPSGIKDNNEKGQLFETEQKALSHLVTMDITTKNCKDKNLSFYIGSDRSSCGAIVNYIIPTSTGIFNVCNVPIGNQGPKNQIIRMTGDNLKLILTPGENVCESAGGYDCDIYLLILDGNEPSNLFPIPLNNSYYIRHLIQYECSGAGYVCSNDIKWKLNSATFDGEKPPVVADCTKPEFKDDPLCKEKVYELLAPLPGLTEVGKDVTFETYFKYIIRFVMGMSSVLAVVMIVIGGIEYMGTDSIFDKNEGKKRIEGALAGLVLLLASYLILNTVNPQLVDIHIGFTKVGIVSEDEQAFSRTETSTTTQYKLANGSTFENPKPSTGVNDFVENYLKKGYSITSIGIKTSENKAIFIAKKGNDQKILDVPTIGFGLNGIAELGANTSAGDMKTPKGNSKITSDRRFSENTNDAVMTNVNPKTKLKYNLGSVFINTGITYKDGGNRGIGFHGSDTNTFRKTQGCIRMYNDDLLALGSYMKEGVDVIIR